MLEHLVREGYQALQHPLLDSICTAEITFPLGDVASQLIKHRRVDWRKVRYTAGLAPLYGVAIHGLVETGDLVGRTISEHPLAKAALGPNLLGNLFPAWLFMNDTVGERENYRLRGLARHYRNLLVSEGGKWQGFKENVVANIPRKAYLKAVAGTLTAWNAIHYANYACAPEAWRSPITLVAGAVWVTILSAWSLREERGPTYRAPEG